MKNFSVNTADFDSLSISGEAPIVQSDLGTAPNQIPLNKDLGSLAYMNAPQIEDLNVDTLELREIAAELSDTAVDVFVYDTRRDSDGGAWRSRTSHTSWYNEELNTATRGGRREFPAVAVIVAEADKVTIYDGDDPDLSMWMIGLKFNAGDRPAAYTCVHASNGVIVLGGQYEGVVGGIELFNFIGDTMYIHGTSGGRQVLVNISDGRSGDLGPASAVDVSLAIVNGYVNDVTMTVLPNAPIDTETGLPVPTIAVATDGGVSVIKDDGSVVDITRGTGSSLVNSISFDNNNKLIINNSGTSACYYNIDIPREDLVQTEFGGYFLFSGSVPASNVNLVADSKVLKNYVGHASSGLNILEKGPTSQGDGMIAYTTSSYNTGWMPGDIKLAALSDTKNETVGVDESTELVTNGTFDDDSDWTKGTGWAINGGVATKTGSDNTSILQDIDTIAGKNYVVSLDIVSGTVNTGAKLYVGGVLVLDGLKDAQSISVDFVATDDSTTIAINGGSFDGGSIDNISVKQTGELVTNGTFDNGTEGWSSVLNATLSNDANRIKVDGTSNFATALQSITGLVSGKKYTISLELIAGTSTKPYFTTNNTGGANQISNNFDFGFQSHTFTSNGETLELRLVNSSEGGGYAFFDNVSVRLAEDDRSVNDNGLQIFGEITKTPVAPGADLVAYSGFSANNYLMQPYNPDFNFGTGDFCVMWWAKISGSGFYSHWTREYYDTNAEAFSGTSIEVFSHGGQAGKLAIYISDNGYVTNSFNILNGNITTNTGQWTCFMFAKTLDNIKVYINGKLDIDGKADKLTGLSDIGKETFNVGVQGSGGSPMGDGNSIALLRITKTVPTAEQIAKIYRDEKPLFTDGAQATLYGTSDAVTALAYDDSENLLHVGTASGRSSFNGLKRVDNTTTAVSTAISATEGLVIEQ